MFYIRISTDDHDKLESTGANVRINGEPTTLRRHGDWLEYQDGHSHVYNALDSLNQTPLHFACRFGTESSVKYLVDHGANKYVRSNSGLTPLDCIPQRTITQVATGYSASQPPSYNKQGGSIGDKLIEGVTRVVKWPIQSAGRSVASYPPDVHDSRRGRDARGTATWRRPSTKSSRR
jgi:hypothetical protein